MHIHLPFILDTPNCPWNWFWTGKTSIFITSSITSSISKIIISVVEMFNDSNSKCFLSISFGNIVDQVWIIEILW